MIAAIMACLPDLKQEIEEAGISNAPSVIDAYLIKKELAPLGLGENNYRNWISKAEYNPNEK